MLTGSLFVAAAAFAGPLLDVLHHSNGEPAQRLELLFKIC